MHWDDEDRTLYIGFDQGKVVRLKLEENNIMQYAELPELGIHTLRITGITSDPETGTFTTVSDDGQMKVTENSSGSVVAQIQPCAGGLKQLLTFQHRNCLAVSDAKGNFHLYGRKGTPLEPIVSMEVASKSEIKGLTVNSTENYLGAGCQDGTINLFDLGASGRERLVKPFISFQGNQNVRCLQWRETPRRELIAGNADGLVTVWDFKQQKPIYVLQAHTSAITKMEWHEDKQILITVAKDKCFKIWQFPALWVDEQDVDLQRGPPAVKKQNKNAQRTGTTTAAQADEDDDSDDSDDGLGRIRPDKPSSKPSLPAGLG